MMQEVAKVHQNYSILHNKVDIVADAVTKLDEYHTSMNSKEFVHLQGLLEKVKEKISKLEIPPSSTVSQESISQMLSSLETRLKADFDRLLKYINLMPTVAPPVSTGVQGGENGVGASNDTKQGKVVGRVIRKQIPTTILVSTTVTSTTITSKPLKGIVIGSSTGGSSSKPLPSTEELKGKGKGVLIEPTSEEKNLSLE
ncbi:unnamed protein product [Lactuca saligna]|uniref:Uncharacterized protein n=1 Tax=Lactuca saligna TaxID=75948 RepID=A0AA35VX76_LACSI|nr:unnamed protein product [Lactuca saligna]